MKKEYHHVIITKDGKRYSCEKIDYNRRISISKKFNGKEWIIPFENIQFIMRQDEESYQKMLKEAEKNTRRMEEEKCAATQTEKVMKQLKQIISEKGIDTNYIYDDMEEFRESLRDFYSRNFGYTDKSGFAYDLNEFFEDIIKETQTYLEDSIKNKNYYIDSLKEIKEKLVKK